MSIIDCFLFNDELAMLELRLNTLAPVVDAFVLVEATETFQGNPKPLLFMEHRDDPRFAPFVDRIAYVATDQLPAGDAWARERYQRNAIRNGLRALNPEHYDIVLVSDVDELPSPDAVTRLPKTRIFHPDDSVAFIQSLYCFTLNWRYIRPWFGTRAIRYGALAEPQALRSTLGPRYNNEPAILNGGWSFSWMGGPAAVRAKARAFSHTEVNRPEYLTNRHLAACIYEGRSFVPGDGNEYVWQDIDDRYPPYLLEHLDDTYSRWLHPRVRNERLNARDTGQNQAALP